MTVMSSPPRTVALPGHDSGINLATSWSDFEVRIICDVIPRRRKVLSPESISHKSKGYGFGARHLAVAPRND
jgi:hypothetical protein